MSRNLNVCSGEYIRKNTRNCLKFIVKFLRYKSAMIRWDAESVMLVFGSQVQYEILPLVVANFGDRHFNCLRFHQLMFCLSVASGYPKT